MAVERVEQEKDSQEAETTRRPARQRQGFEVSDELYGTVRLAAWAAALVQTPQLQRLADVSLSDVPGNLLVQAPFPSRLAHTYGVYSLARLSRPRDRMVQVAALMHDIGHGPFSHLTEPLMRDVLGIDHEQRSAALLPALAASLMPAARRALTWVDWDEVARLVLGTGGARGKLLNGLLDYDNIDNVARFLRAARLGIPSYDPRMLARGLRVVPDGQQPGSSAQARDGVPVQIERGELVALTAEAQESAAHWLADRRTVYAYLHEGHRNLAAHAMLQKAVLLLAVEHLLPMAFFDKTDAEALAFLRRSPSAAAAQLTTRVEQNALYSCIYEAELAHEHPVPPRLRKEWRERLALEAQIASHAGLLPGEVVVDVLASAAQRQLPPVASAGPSGELQWLPAAAPLPYTLHVFVTPGAAPDYVRRARMAAERIFEPLGAVARGSQESGSTH